MYIISSAERALKWSAEWSGANIEMKKKKCIVS